MEEIRYTYKILVGNREGKTRIRLERVDWILLVHDRDR
jgi:hypothetical protein